MELGKKVSKRTWKRCLVAILSFCLCLGCLPVTASAKDKQDVKEEKTEQKISNKAVMARSYYPDYATEEDKKAIETADSLVLNTEEIVTINSAGGKNWFSFTPNETKTYYFYSLNSNNNGEDSDPYGALYKQTTNGIYECIANNDDHYYDYWTSLRGLDFCIGIDLEANTTYYLCASLYEDDLTGSYDIKVSDIDPTALTEESIGETTPIDELNKDYNVSLESLDDDKWFTFTPTEAGIYYFYSKSTTDTYGALYQNIEGIYKCLNSSDGYYGQLHNVVENKSDFYFSYYLEQGKEYYLRAALSDDYDEKSFVIKVSLNNPYAITEAIVGNPEIIRLNEMKSVSIQTPGEAKWFTFTPTEAGIYYFYSKGEEDPMGGLYYYDNMTREYVFWDRDDDYDMDGNFNLAMNLEANKTYYLATNFYSSSDIGSFTVGLSTNPNAYKEDSPQPPSPDPSDSSTTATTQVKNSTKPAQTAGVPATGISVAKKSIALKKGGKIKLSTILTPLNTTDSITFTSSKPKVAQVSQNGMVKAKKPGKAKITIRTSSGKTAVVTVNVKKNAVKTKKVSMKKKLTVQSGTVRFLSYKVNPKQSTDKMKWKSSKKGVVSVDSNGKIIAKKKGKAVITVKIGNKKASCKVTVR